MCKFVISRFLWCVERELSMQMNLIQWKLTNRINFGKF